MLSFSSLLQKKRGRKTIPSKIVLPSHKGHIPFYGTGCILHRQWAHPSINQVKKLAKKKGPLDLSSKFAVLCWQSSQLSVWSWPQYEPFPAEFLPGGQRRLSAASPDWWWHSVCCVPSRQRTGTDTKDRPYVRAAAGWPRPQWVGEARPNSRCTLISSSPKPHLMLCEVCVLCLVLYTCVCVCTKYPFSTIGGWPSLIAVPL